MFDRLGIKFIFGGGGFGGGICNNVFFSCFRSVILVVVCFCVGVWVFIWALLFWLVWEFDLYIFRELGCFCMFWYRICCDRLLLLDRFCFFMFISGGGFCWWFLDGVWLLLRISWGGWLWVGRVWLGCCFGLIRGGGWVCCCFGFFGMDGEDIWFWRIFLSNINLVFSFFSFVCRRLTILRFFRILYSLRFRIFLFIILFINFFFEFESIIIFDLLFLLGSFDFVVRFMGVFVLVRRFFFLLFLDFIEDDFFGFFEVFLFFKLFFDDFKFLFFRDFILLFSSFFFFFF